MKMTLIAGAMLLAAALPAAVVAQTVVVQNAWVRSTVRGQQATGAFMTLTAKSSTRLIGVSTPVAGVAAVHEMEMKNDVMTMHELESGLELPAGKAVQLKPGSLHIMLMDLKQPLQNGSSIPLTLVFRDTKGAQSKQEIRLLASASAPDS